MRRAAEGDRRAFAALVESHWERLVRLARSVVGDAEAEDAVQDGLLTAWEKLPTLRDPNAFPAWITRVVSRTCGRRAHRGRFHAAAVPLAAAGPVPAPVPDDPDSGLDVERFLAALAPRQRAVMHLTVVEGLSDGEIGSALGITAASVRSHRRRARQRLHRLFAEVHDPPSPHTSGAPSHDRA